MTTFSIEPSGRFSLAAAQDFARGFAAGIGAHGTTTGLLMTFPVEGWGGSAAVDVVLRSRASSTPNDCGHSPRTRR